MENSKWQMNLCGAGHHDARIACGGRQSLHTLQCEPDRPICGRRGFDSHFVAPAPPGMRTRGRRRPVRESQPHVVKNRVYTVNTQVKKFTWSTFWGRGSMDTERKLRAGQAPPSEAQSHVQTKHGRGLVVPIPSDHQARLRRRRVNTSPHDSPPLRTLSESVPRSKRRQSWIRQRQTIGLAFHRGEPKTSGADQRLS
jgi:hypothetical protein